MSIANVQGSVEQASLTGDYEPGTLSGSTRPTNRSPYYDSMIDALNTVSISRLSEGIGQYYNYRYVGNDDLRNLLANDINKIAPERRDQVREIIRVYLDPNGRYWNGNTQNFEQWNTYDVGYAIDYENQRLDAERQRQTALADLLGDRGFDNFLHSRNQKIKDGTATLQQFKVWSGQHNNVDAIEKLYLDIFFPNVDEEKKRIIINDIQFAGRSNTIPKAMRDKLDSLLQTAYNFWAKEFTRAPIKSVDQLVETVFTAKGGTSIRDNPINFLKLDTNKLNSIIQSVFSVIDDPSGGKANLFLMDFMINEGKDQGVITPAFFEKHKNVPIEVIKIAIPYIMAYKVGANIADGFIEYIAEHFKTGAPITDYAVEKVTKALTSKIDEGRDYAEKETEQEITEQTN